MANEHGYSLKKDNTCGCGNFHRREDQPRWKIFLPSVVSSILFLTGLILDYSIKISFFTGSFKLIWYIFSYLPVALPVIREASRTVAKRDFFNEFTLVVVATLGAFFIGKYPESVAVMLFYSVGKLFQELMVSKSIRNIKALLEGRSERARVIRGNKIHAISPQNVSIGETIQIKVGEKVPLDGVLVDNSGIFNTSALTGESVPRKIHKGEPVLAGMINLNTIISVKVERKYEDSSFARILELGENATLRKTKTELLIRKIAHVYTPFVFLLALAITILPALVVPDYVFRDWIYQALVFLVISSPCALVISIPLSYFEGIGAASRNGILFKRANYLDLMTKVNTVVMDKTGVLTKGIFKVKEVVSVATELNLSAYITTLESHSNHPIAKAIVEYFTPLKTPDYSTREVVEVPGYGIKGFVNEHEVIAGNVQMMQLYDFEYDEKIDNIKETVIVITIDDKYAGYIVIGDQVKDDSLLAIHRLQKQGVKIVILSGDKTSIAEKVALDLGVNKVYGDLLSEDKIRYTEELKADEDNVIAFVGNSINDAPSLTLSDVGIAMGGMGSDAAIEVADVIIQTDQPSKIATSIKIAKATKQVVIQNIILALSVKLIVLILGGFGLATIWGAIFADMGIVLLVILNTIRTLKKEF